MIRTKNLICSLDEVPIEWVFENYLNLTEKLTGQDVKIKSVFHSTDKNPSMFVYYDTNKSKYKFKDFSSGTQGDHVQLVKELFKLSNRYESGVKIISDYNAYTLSGGPHVVKDFKIRDRYKVTGYTKRGWVENDQKYWMRFKIGSKLLTHYNVVPLESFTLSKNEGLDTLNIKNALLYGYFKNDGTLYKIYQPLLKERKFIKVKDYIQGIDQLKYTAPYLIICSSLKDAMVFCKMGFKNAEVIAPDSENSMISEKLIVKLKGQYKKVCTLFDNDDAGVKAMQKYKDRYNLSGVHLKLEKDLADCVAIHGIANTREHLYPILTKALTGSIKQLPE